MSYSDDKQWWWNGKEVGSCQPGPHGAATYGPKCLAYQAAAGKPQGLTLVWTPGGFGGGDYRIKLS